MQFREPRFAGIGEAEECGHQTGQVPNCSVRDAVVCYVEEADVEERVSELREQAPSAFGVFCGLEVEEWDRHGFLDSRFWPVYSL